MKTYKTLSKQSGFFSLGLALIVLAFSGTATYVITSNHDAASISIAKTESIKNGSPGSNTDLDLDLDLSPASDPRVVKE